MLLKSYQIVTLWDRVKISQNKISWEALHSVPTTSTHYSEEKQLTFNMLFIVFKECDFQQELKSWKSATDGTRTNPTAQVVLIKGS